MDEMTLTTPGSIVTETTIRSTLDEPGKVSVGIAGSGDKPARMLQANRFEAELPLEEGTNFITIAAMDGSYNRSDHVFSVEVAARGAQSFAYDINGNLESDGIRNYEWDSLSRLKKITWAPGKTTDFKYNALGQRCERIETDGALVSRRFHLFDGIQIIDRRAGTDPNTAAIDRRYFQQGEQRGGGTSWDNYHYSRDHLGSIREVLKSDGTLAARYDYDPYGKRIPQYQSATYHGGCDIGFTGHLTIPSLVPGQTETILTHFRPYDPDLGRWPSADPIGEAGGMNLYAYVGNNPINLWDPLGLEEINYTNSDGSIDYWRFAKDLAGATGKQFKGDCADPEKNRNAAAGALASGLSGPIAGRLLGGAKGTPLIKAADPNKLKHIFGQSRHGLDGIVKHFGSRNGAFRAMQKETEAALKKAGQNSGKFEISIKLGGESVKVRGAMVDGVCKIGTAYK